MKQHLIISDFDGTLSGGQHEVSDTTKEVIRRLLDEGHLFYIATGRMKGLVADVAYEIDPRVRVIGSNGGIIQTDSGFESTLLESDQKKLLFDIAMKRDVPLLFFTDIDTLYTHSIPDFFSTTNSFHEANGLTPIYKKLESWEELNNHKIINAIATMRHHADPLSILTPMRDEILSHASLNVTSSNESNLEIYDRTVSKGNALLQIMAHHNIQASEVISFGDGLNDISMLEIAGTSVAMANAMEPVKEIAKFETTTNVENGVAQFLMNYFK